MAVKTGSVERLVGSYQAWAANGASRVPAWLKDLREGGIRRFVELGFPNLKQEAWRFTSVAPITETQFELAHPASRIPQLEEIRPFLVGEAGDRLVFVDGFFAPALSTSLLGGVRVASLAQALRENPETIQHHLCKYANTDERPFCALNTAFVAEGAFVHVPATQSHQGRDSTLNLHFVAFGSALARHDIGAVLAGPGGTLILNGLYLLAGAQHADHHTTIDHAADHCDSHEYFNGVLDGHARGVFTGRIIVRPGAQKTDSKQTNNNLLLSADAHADSQPQLEIYADDVKCTHGSTVGPLDPRALFYLRSRGVGENEARRLLTYGFAAEILGRVEVAPLRVQLDRIVRDRVAQP